MKRFASCISVFAFLIGYLSASALEAAQLKKVRLAFSALAYANPPFWIAHDLKLFEKYGIESEIV
jgi:ABC-type nitrate/sulfonate/bicarbonate transport system substrate-binding protein